MVLKMNLLAWRIVLNKIIFAIFYSICLSIPPFNFEINNNILLHRDNSNSLPSNGVIDIEISSDELIFYGTGGGLGKSIIQNGTPLFYSINEIELPRGGNPALFVNDSIIVVSGVTDTLAQGDYMSMGTGISISQDYGETWTYFSQPIDPIPDNDVYLYTDWYGETIKQLAVTVAINNVSYDITVSGDYIYTANWAGGIRRIKFRNNAPIIEGEEASWEILPLPQDASYNLSCDEGLPTYYTLDPNDPINGGNHNHKGFAVESQGDSIIWVGTANGINKGIIMENNCVSWTHYTSEHDGISGNWVIGFSIQELEYSLNPKIWAITWSTNITEQNSVSYSSDLGATWSVSNMITELELKVFNISTFEEKVYIASDKGLYYSEDGHYFEKISRPIEYNLNGDIVEEILSNSVYSVAETNEYLFVGTGDGIGKTENIGLNWNTYRFWEQPEPFYAYPNPFFVNSNNQLNGDGHVRFISKPNFIPNKLIIYDFSMNKVIEINDLRSIDDEIEIIWNGRNNLNQIVANGVYFCNLLSQTKNIWTKLVVIN